MPTHLYQPFYCEENVWQWLDQAVDPDRYALFITNPAQQVAVWQQRLMPAGEAVLWDYHVVALTRTGPEVQVWDFDTRLPLPSPLSAYLRATFLPLPPGERALAPQFRLVPAADFRATFASDRRHMRDGQGQWLQPPPPWPPIGSGHTLDRYLDLADPIAGTVLDLPGLRRWASAT
ncbi:MAG: hypothetical protein HY902_10515 [Deltaproteobacteria bacterium]|nr:hypothetical protein [Deltaproteobacteria bacterium]